MKPLERSLLLAVALVVLIFDVWTVRSNNEPWHFGKKQTDYYNALIDGWLSGQLAMKMDVPPALLKLADPYDPAQRPPGLAAHDASLYKGKYYLYFGAAPVVTLMLPFRLLTRTDLPQAVAVIVFVYGAFLVSAAVWLRVRKKYFPASTPLTGALGVLALGMASLGPVLLRRPHVWELPIASAYCFAMLTLFAVFESLHSPRQRLAWFAGAGLFLGLAIASRPPYLFATPLLLAPLLHWWRENKSAPWREVAAGMVPLAAVGGAMALHNFLRFGDPLQFGQAYQLSLDYEAKMPHFRPVYAAFNAWRYFFSAARWSEYFPFISPAVLPAKPPGFGGFDDVYGLFANLPLAWFAVAVPVALTRRTSAERAPLLAWLQGATILFFALAGVLLCFFGSLARYELDFAPTLMLLAGIGMLAAERWIRGWPQWTRGGLRGLGSLAALGSVAFAVLFSLQLNGLFRERNPAGYRETARVLNHVPAWIQALRGERPSAWEIEFWLPRGEEGRAMTLLSVGDAPAIDRVFVREVDATRVQFGFAREAMPDVLSAPIAISFLQTHRVRMTLGAFLPPDTHPWFADANPTEARLASRLVKLELDGQVALQVYRRFTETTGGRVRVGPKSLGDDAHPRFAGEMIETRRVPIGLRDLQLASVAGSFPESGGTFALKLKLPARREKRSEPLVVTGATGQGDMFGLEYLDESHVRFVFDHWGSALLLSKPLPIDAAPHDLIVKMPWLAAPAGGRVEQRGELQVVLDGGVVWSQPTMGYLADPEEIAVGENPIGGSNLGLHFSGEVIAVRRRPE